ncbi:MAG: hypothetical protein IKJ07_00965 [Clostridia bacterium]|nr:hypothetical protein [Clostridia bacterium]
MSEIMPILTNLVPLILMGVIALIVIINVITGLIGGLKKRLAALVAIIISAIVSAIVTTIVCSPNSGLVTWATGLINDLLSQTELGITVGLEPGSVGEVIVYYITMAIKPVFFTAVYVVLSFVLGIVLSIIVKFIPILNKIPGVAKRLGGAGLGIVTGLLVALFTLVPVVGTILVGADVIDTLAIAEAEAEAEADVEEDAETPSLKEAYKGFEYMGYGLLYDGLASETYYGEKVYLRQDVNIIVNVVDKLIDAFSDLESIDEEATNEMGAALDELEGSSLIRGVLASIISDAAESWSNGETYLGLEKISADELFNPIIDTMLEILSTTDKDTVISDVRTVVDVLGVLAKHDMLSVEEESGDVLDKINDGAIITEMLDVIGENERMYPLADEVTRLGLRTLASTLGIPDDADERYDALMNEIASVMNDTYGTSADERYTAVADGLEKALSDYGVEVSGEALESVAQGIIADLGSEGDLEGNDVKEFFILYAAASAEDSSASTADGLVHLSTSKSNGVVINSDGTVTVNGVTLQNYTAENYRNSAAYAFGSSGVSFDDAGTLYSAESMKSSVVTLEEIMGLLGEYGECEDVAAEAQKIGDIFGEFLSMVADDGINEGKTTEVFEKIGQVLDEMKYSEIFGPEVTSKLLSAIMQSETLVDKLGLSRADLTHIAENLNSHALDKENGYAGATSAVATTVDAVKVSADTNATKEEKIQSVEAMIHSVNTDNSEMLTTIVTGNVVSGVNSNVENSDTVADSLSHLINNMAQFKEGNPTDEAVSSEAEAVSQVISLAMTGADDGAVFNTEDTKGSIDATPDEFIGQMVNSDVVMKTVNQTVENEEQGSNPYGVKYSNEKEQQNVTKALENYYVENGGGEELAEKLQNLAIVMNVEINLGK